MPPVDAEDKILEIAAELGRVEEKKRLLLAELERLSASPSIAQRRRLLIAEILRTGSGQRYRFQMPRDYNLLEEIRKFLNSQPERPFSASEIKAHLGIPSSMEKTFYAALAKLANTGQIHRVGRATYQAARLNERRGGPAKSKDRSRPR